LNVAFVCCRTCPLSLDFSFLPTFFLSFLLSSLSREKGNRLEEE
jgi:hypothetical protein